MLLCFNCWLKLTPTLYFKFWPKISSCHKWWLIHAEGQPYHLITLSKILICIHTVCSKHSACCIGNLGFWFVLHESLCWQNMTAYPCYWMGNLNWIKNTLTTALCCIEDECLDILGPYNAPMAGNPATQSWAPMQAPSTLSWQWRGGGGRLGLSHWTH